jgi:predicted nucleic acid-binding protein
VGKRQEAVFVDAGVFLRFLAGEPEGDYRRARELFEQAERGGLFLETSAPVVARVLAELREEHGLGRREVLRVGETILGARNLRVRERPLLRRALALSGELGVEFGEALNIVHAGGRAGRAVATMEPRRYGGGASLYKWGRDG